MVNYPHAIIHVDGDAFFVGCEVASRPWLRGKPVVTGAERGIASALSYEAKARGVRRGMSISEVKKICPDVTIIHGDYEKYSMYSQRMLNIVRRYTEEVEGYSIDECFADISNLGKPIPISYEEIARRIKYDLDNELGMTFSVGLSVNKVLAKCASKWQKPSGLTFIPFEKIDSFLTKIPVSKIWGIGPSTAISLSKYKIYTALDLASKTYEWVGELFTKPIQEIHRELRGEFIYPLEVGAREAQKSIMRTRTFRPPSKNQSFVLAELSKNVEEASRRLRELGLYAREFSFFLKTQEFRYHSMSMKLGAESSIPSVFLKEIRKNFDEVFQSNILYRTTGVRFFNLIPKNSVTLDLFGKKLGSERMVEVFKSVDQLAKKFGNRAIFLASSIKARVGDARDFRHLNIPSMGEVR